MEILLALLIEWLHLNADMTIEHAPTVEIHSPESLEKKYGAPVYALYAHHEGTIYLADTVDLSTITGASVLIHELVHHYQNISGAMDDYACIRESEKMAYNIQRDYLTANKAAVMPELDPFNVLVRSLCDTLLWVANKPSIQVSAAPYLWNLLYKSKWNNTEVN